LAAIVIFAAAIRFWHITLLPPGYWYDEANKSVVALQIARGQRFPIYVTDYQGEAGYFWLLAAWFRLFGPSFYGTRYVAAVLGTATIPLTYWAVSTHYRAQPNSRWLGLGAAGWLSFLLWHVLWSRLGLELIAVPMFSIALLGLMAKAWQRQEAWIFAMAGAVLGLSLYINPAARVLPLQALFNFALLSHGPFRRRVTFGLIFFASGAILFSPLGLFFLQNPHWFVARMAFTSANTRSGGLSAYVANAIRTILSINFQGDALLRHNLSLRPALDPVSSIWMLAGLASMWPRRGTPAIGGTWRTHGAILGSLALGLLPAVLSDGAPNFARTLGVSPFLVVLPALGFAWAITIVQTPAARAVLVATIVVAAGWNLVDYFYRYPRQPGLFDAFEEGQWALVQGALQAGRDGTGYLVLDEPSLRHPMTELAGNLNSGDLRSVNGYSCLAYPAITSTPVLLGTLETWRPLLAERLPGASVQLVLHEPEVYPYGALFRLPAGYAAPAYSERAIARLGDRVDLLPIPLPAQPVAAGTVMPVSLRWRVAQPVEAPYNVFVHLASTAQPFIAGVDGEPCGGWYPTDHWHYGEVIEHSMQLQVPAGLAPGQYQVAVGLYDWQTGARLPVVQDNQREPDRAFVGNITVK
jgi:hypothetical protein